MEEEIIRLFNLNKGYGEIAKALGTTKENVRYYLSKHNLKRGYDYRCEKVKCEYCETEFKQKTITQKYCSAKCSSKHYRLIHFPKKERIIKNKEEKVYEKIYCVECGKEINRSKFGKKKYCSKECHKQWLKNNPRYTKKCNYCGNEFKTNLNKQMYCSYECSGKSDLNKTIPNQYGTLQDREDKYKNNFNKQYIGKWIYKNGYKDTDSPINIECLKCRSIKTVNAMVLRKKVNIQCECELLAIRNERKIKEELNRSRKELINVLKKLNRQRIKEFNKAQKILDYQNNIKEYECLHCGNKFLSDKFRKYCSCECIKKSNDYHKSVRRREKIRTNGKYDWSISIPKLIKRDKVCKLCGNPIDINDRVNAKGTVIVGKNYPSIDHIIPVSKGGTHTWDNVQLAHVGCNTLKSNKTNVIAKNGRKQLSLNI